MDVKCDSFTVLYALNSLEIILNSFFVGFSMQNYCFSALAKYLFMGVLSIVFVACSENSSSASEEFDAAKVCPESGRGIFIDERDGQEYKYTTIGDQVWMAENLRYEMRDSVLTYPSTGEEGISKDTCYYPEDDCREKGRVYNWLAAYYACPNGWHLPSEEEWQNLIKDLGEEKEAGFRLKSSTGWIVLNPGDELNWKNECGFSALPTLSSDIEQNGMYATWWLFDYRPDSYILGNYNAWIVKFDGYTHFTRLEFSPPKFDGLFSVRCLNN